MHVVKFMYVPKMHACKTYVCNYLNKDACELGDNIFNMEY